jgi:YD repeat-containing protein
VPTRIDTVLVQSVVYDTAGRMRDTVDPMGRKYRTVYDMLGRKVRTIENFVGVTVGTTEYGYNGVGMPTRTFKLRGSGQQVTQRVYGAIQSDVNELNSNDVVVQIR